MKKLNVKGIYNFGNITRYVIELREDINLNLMSILSSLGFDEETSNKLDFIVDEASLDYLYLNSNGMECHLFIKDGFLNFILKTNLDKEIVNKIMKKEFDFFNQNES